VSDVVVKINQSADALEAVKLQLVLLDSMSTHKKVMLDAGDVDRMTTPVMQVILAAANYAKVNEIQFSLVDTENDTLKNAFEELGLNDQYQALTSH
jgi:anti-anti-sigma regulatory factor